MNNEAGKKAWDDMLVHAAPARRYRGGGQGNCGRKGGGASSSKGSKLNVMHQNSSGHGYTPEDNVPVSQPQPTVTRSRDGSISKPRSHGDRDGLGASPSERQYRGKKGWGRD